MTIVSPQGEILLGKRLSGLGKGKWGLPGGKVEDNETLVNCAIRETREETGIEFGFGEHIRRDNSYESIEEGDKHIVTINYYVRLRRDVIALLKEPDKCAGWDWFQPDKLPTELFACTPQAAYMVKNLPSEYHCRACDRTTPKTSWGVAWMTCPCCGTRVETNADRRKLSGKE